MALDYYFSDFNKKDFKEIQKLWEITGMGNPERADDACIIEACNAAGGKFICLRKKDNSEIIGTCWISFDGRRMYLHHFCIKPDFQNLGLGTALGKESLKFLKEKGVQVKLEVQKNNIAAKRLYEKLGFFAFQDYDIYMIREY